MREKREEKNLLDFLYRNVKIRNWEEVIKKCAEELEALSMMLTQAKDTTLHLAVYDYNVEVVARLVKLICRSQREEVLKLKNERGNTPLHVAAAMGCARMCHIIGSVDEKLVDERNKDGESPLFLAALHGHKMAFFCLYDFCKMDLNRVRSNCRRKLNGDTILHCALKNEQLDMAFQLINLNNEAATWVNREGYTPLHVLATKPTAFKSGAYIGHLEYIVYHCIWVDELKPASAATWRQAKKPTKAMGAATFFPENYATCISLVTNLWNGFLTLITCKTPWERKVERNPFPCEYNEAKGPDLEKDADNGIEINETHESNPPLDTQLLKRLGGHQSVLGCDEAAKKVST